MAFLEELTSVLVEAHLNSPLKRDSFISCSGILLDSERGIVLTTGFILSPLLSSFKSVCFSSNDKTPVNLRETVQAIIKSLQFFVSPTNKAPPSKDGSNNFFNTRYVSHVVRTWCFEALAHTLKEILNEDLKFTCEGLATSADEVLTILLSTFILLHFEPPGIEKKALTPSDAHIGTLTEVLSRVVSHTSEVTKGDLVWTESHLFGDPHPVLANSLSRGIVVNTFRCVLLTDARTVPGSEGGIIFQKKDNKKAWIGIVISPLFWKAKDLIGFTLACKAQALILDILGRHQLNKWSYHQLTCNLLSCANVKKEFQSVVLIKVEHTWGSGIVISQKRRLILTCAHVVRGSEEVTVFMEYPQPSKSIGKVLFQTPNAEVFDVALIQLQTNIPVEAAVFKEMKCYEGQEILAVGYSLFSSHWNFNSLVTSGIISRIVSLEQKPILFQTSCAIYSGASGGAIFDGCEGNALAMIVCNSKDQETNITYPHVNLALPLAVIFPLIIKYISSNDINHLSSLHTKDENIKQMWHLGDSREVSELFCSKL